MCDLISSRQNQWVKRLTAARRGKGEWAGLCFPEGPKLCAEAAAAGLKIRAVFSVAERSAEAAWLGDAETLRFVLSPELFRSVSDTVNPQGILLLAEKPTIRPLEDLVVPDEADLSILVLENIQDPGNLGTMLRSALALGWNGAVLAGATADPFQAKALRAAMGCSFRLPLYRESESRKIIENFRRAKLAIITAALDGKALPDFKRRGSLSLWIGNEGTGLSADVLTAADEELTIPMPGGAESLNAAAAAAILMYRLREELLG